MLSNHDRELLNIINSRPLPSVPELRPSLDQPFPHPDAFRRGTRLPEITSGYALPALAEPVVSAPGSHRVRKPEASGGTQPEDVFGGYGGIPAFASGPEDEEGAVPGLPAVLPAALPDDLSLDMPTDTLSPRDMAPPVRPEIDRPLPVRDSAPGLSTEGLEEPRVSETTDVPNKLPIADKSQRDEKTASETASETAAQSAAAKELVAALTTLPADTLESVEWLTLAEFLARVPGGDDALRRAVRLYWQTSESAAAYVGWQKQVAFLEGAFPAAGASSAAQAAKTAAKTARNDALATLRADAVQLGEIAGFTREIWPADVPHAGAYNTRFEMLAEAGEGTPRLAVLNRIVSLRWQQWTAAVAAYRSAEYVLQEVARPGRPETEVLQAAGDMRQRQSILFRTLVQYNMDILEYALAVSPKRGASLAPLLVMSAKKDETPTLAPDAGVPPAPVQKPGNVESVLDPADRVPLRDTERLAPPRLPAEVGLAPEEDVLPDPLDGDVILEDPLGGLRMPDEIPTEEIPPRGGGYERIGGETGSSSTLPSVPSRGAGTEVQPQTSWKPVFPDSADEIRHFVAKIPLTASDEDSGAAPAEGETLTLLQVLRRVSPSFREQAAKEYWRYTVIQSQRMVLEYQAEILTELGRVRLQNPASAEDALAGLRLMEANQALRVQQRKLDADAWDVVLRMFDMWALRAANMQALPVATSRPNTGEYRLNLDEFTPGTPRYDRARQLARHLEFCVSLCLEAHKEIDSLGDMVPPAPVDGALPTAAISDFPAFFMSLEQARAATGNYLRLIYVVNSSLVSCTFLSDSAAALSADQLNDRLTGQRPSRK